MPDNPNEAPNQLREDFPEHSDRIRQLERDDPDFRAKAQEYHKLSRAAARSPLTDEPTEEVSRAELEKNRDLARDELFRLILR